MVGGAAVLCCVALRCLVVLTVGQQPAAMVLRNSYQAECRHIPPHLLRMPALREPALAAHDWALQVRTALVLSPALGS